MLENARQTIKVGRRVGNNQKVCNGINVSKEHLVLSRDVVGGGDPGDDWTKIGWSILDLGSMCGTFVNREKIGDREVKQTRPFSLNNGDLIGVGCPEGQSSPALGKHKAVTFVYKIKAPEAYNIPVPQPREDVDAEAPTPPPTQSDDLLVDDNQHDLDAAPVIANLPDIVPLNPSKKISNVPEVAASKKSSDKAIDSPVPSQSKKRKRLLSYSDDERGEVNQSEVNKSKKSKSNPVASFKPKTLETVLCRVSIMRVPRRAVSAKVDEGGKVVKWNRVSVEDYKIYTRQWRGVKADGSEGTPLFAELDTDLSDISDGEENLGVKEKDLNLDLSPISSEDEEVNRAISASTKSKSSSSANRCLKLKQEAVEMPNFHMNYSLNDDAAVITINDSDEEEIYNQSQNINVNEVQLDDSASDRDSPTIPKDQDPYFSEGELSDANDVKDVEDEDDDEIQILNESQNSLFAAVLKVAVKKEPVEDVSEDLDQQLKFLDKQVKDFEDLSQSQSLLEELREENDLDIPFISDLVHAVEGATETIVINAHKRLVTESNPTPEYNEVLPEVIQDCEDNLMKKVSKSYGMDPRQIKLIILELKRYGREKVLTEKRLVDAIHEKKKIDKLMDEITSEYKYSSQVLKEAVQDLKTKEHDISKESIVSKICDQNNKIEIIVKECGCDENAARIKLQETDGNVEAAKKLIDEESKDIEEDVPDNLNKFEEEDDQMSQELEELNKSKKLATCFDVSEDIAEKILLSVDNDLNKASEVLLDKMETEAVREAFGSEDDLKRSKSPSLLDEDDDIDDLLKDDSEGENDENVNQSKEKSDNNLIKPTSNKKGPELIDAPILPQSGFGCLRGKSAVSNEILKKKKEPLIPVKKAIPISKENVQVRTGPGQSSTSVKSMSSEEIQAKRREKLKQIGQVKEKRSETDKNGAKVSTGVMKTSIPKNQKLLLELEESEASVPRRRKPSTAEKPRERRPSGSSTGGEKSNIPKRRSSTGGFLEDVASMDSNKAKEKARKEKYAVTEDGYKAVKKMSVANVDYNIMSQDISKMPVPHARPLEFSGITPSGDEPSEVRPGKKRLRWRDENGMETLVDIRLIEADNKGMKCGPGNKDLITTIDREEVVKFGNPGKRKPVCSEIDMSNVFKIILEWNPGWFEEQKKEAFKNRAPPVEGSYKLLPLPSSFSSQPEYTRIFLPLMLHELWASISAEYEDKQPESVQVCVQEYAKDSTQQFTILRCIALLTDKVSVNLNNHQFYFNFVQECRSDLASDGAFIQIKLGYDVPAASGRNARIIKPIFGFVQQTHKESLHYSNLNAYGEVNRDRLEMLKECRKNARSECRNVVTFTIKCKGKGVIMTDKYISVDKPVWIKSISRVKPELRKFEALLSLSKSPLSTALVSPQYKNFKVGQGSVHLHASIKDLPQIKKLNSVQKRSIVSIGRAAMTDPLTPHVSLLQGPPGTGKSSTIVGVVLQILFATLKNSNRETFPRIMVVAPSNAAVDEVARKLISARKQLPDKIQFRMIRLGVRHSMHEDVRKYSLDDIIDRMVEEDTAKKKAHDSLKKDIDNKQKQANTLWDEKTEAENEGNMDLASKKKRDWDLLMGAIRKLKDEINKPLQPKEIREMRREAEDKTIAGADIILSTMSSSVGREMERYFVQGTHIILFVANIIIGWYYSNY